MARSVRVVFYAINGGGVGHATRLCAVARWMRRYAAHAGVKLEPIFLSSSEADTLLYAEGFPSFKVPSKSMAAAAGLDKLAFIGLVKQWIWHSVGLLRPDLFVVDTFPRGSFGELPACLDLCRKRAFIYRPVKPELAGQPEFQATLDLYDALIVPEDTLRLPVPAQARSRVSCVGPIAVREPAELLSREQARKQLNLPLDARVVFASAGGGGDPGAATDLAVTREAVLGAGAQDSYLVLGAGPLFRGPPEFGAQLRWLQNPGYARLLRAADVAISGAGYNSFVELRQAGVPAVFIPQRKIADEQDERARAAVEVGSAIMVERPVVAAELGRAVAQFYGPEAHARASAGWRQFGPVLGARRAAAQLLKLVVGVSEVEAAEAAYGDEVLALAAEYDAAESLFIRACQLLNPGISGLPQSFPQQTSSAALAWSAGVLALGVEVEAAVRTAGLFLKRFELAAPAARGNASLRLLQCMVPFNDWRATGAFLRAALQGGELEIGATIGLIERVTADLQKDGLDLYRGIERMLASDPALGDRGPLPQGDGAEDLPEEPENH
jgi:UDP-N-acetylglucosamine--N-acetylmuramyl-(pentapeptide) pyrophosphoryl-undecaprenol N-acetylglucosamine transferase